MSTKEDDYIMAGLTDEERAALAEPDDEDVNATQEELEAKAAAEGGTGEPAKEDNAAKKDEPAPVADDGAAAAAAVPATAAAPAGAEPVAAAADEPGPAPSAPIYVAKVPEDAEAKLAEIATKKADLRKQYDDGDITHDEYDTQKDALSKDERAIEREIDKANIAADMEAQRQKNEWDRDCGNFLKGHPEYSGEANLEAFTHLNETIVAFAKMPRNAALSGTELLEKAHKAVQAERGTPVAAAAAAPAAKPAAKAPTPPVLPPDISRLPAAAGNDPSEGKWASLDALQTANPAGYEAALSKLSDAERDAYLAA